MTAKGQGLAKTEVMRVHPSALTDLNLIRKELKLSGRYKPGDVVEQLIAMYKDKKIEARPFQRAPADIVWSYQTTLDEYKNQYENQCVITRTWKSHFERACEIAKLDPIKVIELTPNE